MVHAAELRDRRHSAGLAGLRECIVRRGQREVEAPEEIEHDEAHLHLREVPAEAAARRVREGRETLGLDVRCCHGAPDARHLALCERALRVEAVGVGAPERGVAVPRPVGDLHRRVAWERHLNAAGAGDCFRELQPSESAVGHRGPEAQSLRDAAVHELQPRKVAVVGVATSQRLEEGVHLLLQLVLELRVPRELEEQPRHGVASGVVARKEDQQHVAVICRTGQIRGANGAGQGATDRPAVRGQRQRGLRTRPLHDLLHGHRQGTDLRAAGLALEGRADRRVRGLHEVLAATQQRQLQLCLCLVQEEVIHVHSLAIGGQGGQSLGAALRTL
mmetsp:Transcript_146892/g.409139  ORF Transcript_146892/g.409139 Transcript_146892/m.409139 type:complete len:332 (+) Transcript_146892:281-1276(+)